MGALVLGGFFLGLAMGSAWATTPRGRRASPWKLAAIGEAAVGLLALPALTLPEWSGRLWPSLGPEALSSWAGVAVRTALAALVVIPPAFAMGVILPGLARAVRGRGAVFLYALNILGGLFGLAFALAWALPRFGVTGTSLAAIGLNAAAALIASLRLPAQGSSPGGEAAAASRPPRPGELGLAMYSGAVVLALEVFAIRAVGFFAPSALQATGLVLGVVLVGLFAASALPARRLPLPASLALACASAWGIGLGWLGPGPSLVIGGDDGSAWPLALRLASIALLVFGPAFFFAGRIFPSLFGNPDKEEPPDWAPLLAVNGIGGLLGAIGAQWWLLPALGPSLGFVAIGWTFLPALALATPIRGLARAGFLLAIAAPLVGSLPIASQFRQEPAVSGIAEVLAVRHAPEGTIAVIEGPRWGRALRFQRQYTLGGTRGLANEAREAHLPLMLHANPRRVGFLGLATGITAGGSLQHPEVREAIAFEISPFVAEAAPRWFGEWNRGFGADPRTEIVVEDARIAIAATSDAFDVIVGDLFFPWEAGAGRLFSREHFLSVRGALRPGGLFCQWLPLYQLTERQARTILATFRSAFPEAEVFRLKWSRETPMLALVGFRDRGLDWEVVRARCLAVRREVAIRDPAIRHPESIAMLYRGRLGEIEAPINTLENTLVELDAGAERLAGDWRLKYLGGHAWANFQAALDGWVRPDPGRLGDLARFSALGRALEDATNADTSLAGPMSDQLRESLPRGLLDDPAADWSLWPAPILPSR